MQMKGGVITFYYRGRNTHKPLLDLSSLFSSYQFAKQPSLHKKVVRNC